MKTDEKEYARYLQGKFLPGRNQYLKYLIYPRYIRELTITREVWDLGFGNGEFLEFCRRRGIKARGIDSNPHFVEQSHRRGLNSELDDITLLNTIPNGAVYAAISDNVLEHLDQIALKRAFSTLTAKLAMGGRLLAIVPGEKGFTRDPTHRTFIDEALVDSLIKASPLVLERSFRFPINSPSVSRFFYLNMTLFLLRKTR